MARFGPEGRHRASSRSRHQFTATDIPSPGSAPDVRNWCASSATSTPAVRSLTPAGNPIQGRVRSTSASGVRKASRRSTHRVPAPKKHGRRRVDVGVAVEGDRLMGSSQCKSTRRPVCPPGGPCGRPASYLGQTRSLCLRRAAAPSTWRDGRARAGSRRSSQGLRRANRVAAWTRSSDEAPRLLRAARESTGLAVSFSGDLATYGRGRTARRSTRSHRCVGESPYGAVAIDAPDWLARSSRSFAR